MVARAVPAACGSASCQTRTRRLLPYRPTYSLKINRAVISAASTADLAQLGAESAAISNEPIFSGLVDEIIQWTRTLSMNRNAAMRLSRRVGQLAMVTEDPRAGTAQFRATGPSSCAAFDVVTLLRAAETESALGAVTELKYVAILGGPGGKTSLPVAVLHHPRVVARFDGRRYFIACNTAEGQKDCLGVVSGALGLSGNDTEALRRDIKDVLSHGDVLLVLDNFESAWEHPKTRHEAEAALAFLADACGATIVVTMRGSERPQTVPWARPFLPPLRPLADSAANQLFVSIADKPGNETETHLSWLLRQLDGVPLAIVLLASLAQYESLDALNRQWAALETSMLRRGTGLERHSSLDVSITLSLNSARMAQVPDAMCLLGLLSVLPSGAAPSDIEV